MQLYVLDRAKNTLATTSSFYSDKHHKELTAGASTFEFTIDKSDSAAQHMTTGNYLVFLDDRGRAWSFTILSYDETQTTKTVAAEDVSIELLNKAMDVWNTDQAYPFSYYFDLVTKGTPWTLGVNQLTDLSRKLVYTGRDTGLGRLLSVLKGFDNAECQFNIKVQQNKPVEFVVDVYKSIGTVQDNIQIVYNNELNDIKKTESRAQFVTALAGVGGLVENQATTDPGLEKHIDFADIDYKDDNFVSPKGDKFLRAVTANKTFNPGTTTYIEDFYDYDTQSAQELLNRTLTQLKERSEPQYTYDADVKVIDPTLDIGDTVTIIDHDYNPALYLQARVATLDKSYTDPTQGAITFCNYRVLNSNLSDQLRAMQNIIDQLPTSESVKLINSNIIKIIATNEELKKQVALSLESANGKSRVWFSKSSTAQDGDIAFIKNADGATEIWKFVEGAWMLDTGLATFEDVKKAASAAADAGSQAVTAGQQASAAGAAAKAAGDFAASAASQSTIETAAAQSAANSAVDQANLAVSQASFANDAADQAKTAAANALGQASTAIANASTAIDTATDAQTKTNSLVTEVDDIAGTIETLATTETVDQLAGTVATTQSLAQFAADGLKLKADTTTVNQINGTINDLKGELDVQADKIAATVTASDVTGMLGNYATQIWTQSQIKQSADSINLSVNNVENKIDNLQVGGRNYLLDSDQSLEKAPNSSLNFTSAAGFLDVVKGKQIVISFDIDVKDAIVKSGYRNRAGISCVFIKEDNTRFYAEAWYTPKAYGDSFKGRVYNVVTVPDDVVGGATTAGLFNQINADQIRLSRPKISVGNTKDDWTSAPEDYASVKKLSELQVTVDGIQGTVQNKADKSQITQLADQITSVVGTVDGLNNANRNYLINSDFSDGTSHWGLPTIEGLNVGRGSYYKIGHQMGIHMDGTSTKRFKGISQNVVIPGKKGNTVSVSFLAARDGAQPGILRVGIHWRDKKDTILDQTWQDIATNNFIDGLASVKSMTFKAPVDFDKVFIMFYVTPNKQINIWLTKFKLEIGSQTSWTPAIEDGVTESQITQLQNDINLRVKTGDLVSQINVSSEGILIDGRKVHITGDTTIDTGVIKTAMIADAAINNAKIANAAIDNAKIANAAITAAKIADLAVGSAQIADGAISSAKIGNAAITSAKIADASILDAKIVNLDGSKIVAHSITADQLDVNAIAVGLNTYGAGWQITPASIAFLPVGTTHTTISLSGDMGITYGDFTTGEILGHTYGTPYSMNAGKDWFNGISTELKYNGADFWAVLTEESNSTVRPRLTYSRRRIAELGVFQGWTFDDNTHFATIGPMDPDDKAQMRVVRGKVADRWATGFINAPDGIASHRGGWLITDDGALYLGRAGRWYNLFDIVKKIGIA